MKTLVKILAFLAVNAAGFFTPFFCYFIGLKTGAINFDDPAFDGHAFKMWFFSGTMMTWSACALFSLAYFLIDGKMRFLFLWSPLVVPLFYGLSVLYSPLLSSL